MTLLALGILPGCGLLIYRPESVDSLPDTDTAFWTDSGAQTEPTDTDTGSQGSLAVSAQPIRPWIEAGRTTSCLLDGDGEITCWGDDSQGLLTDVPPGPWLKLSLGDTHGCALGEDGGITCWGDDTEGQASAPEGTFAGVAAAGLVSCASDLLGAQTCWGQRAWVRGLPARPLIEVRGGSDHHCGLDLLRRPNCWNRDELSYPAVAVQQVVAGTEYACVLDDEGLVDCYGVEEVTDPQGQTTDEPTEPALAVSAGNTHACALLSTGEAVCWGSDAHGQASAPSGTWTQVSAGAFHSCALDAAGSVTCWGIDDGSADDHGQVSDTP